MSLIEKTPPIYIVSGGKGLAGDAIVQSVLIHFPNNKVPVIVVPDVLTQDKMDDIISKVLQTNGVIVHTMVDSDARKMLINSCFQSGVRHIDLAGDLSDYLSNLLNTQPISVYLAMFGWKVANVPIVPGIDPPDSLFKADPKRVFGLNISPVYLIAQRANRVKSLHMDEDTDYINKRKVAEELEYAHRIFDRGGFTEIQITNKPIESSANEILTILTSRFDQEKWQR